MTHDSRTSLRRNSHSCENFSSCERRCISSVGCHLNYIPGDRSFWQPSNGSWPATQKRLAQGSCRPSLALGPPCRPRRPKPSTETAGGKKGGSACTEALALAFSPCVLSHAEESKGQGRQGRQGKGQGAGQGWQGWQGHQCQCEREGPGPGPGQQEGARRA